MTEPGKFEVELFAADVDGPDHPMAASLRELMEEVAEQYRCQLTHFEVRAGTVAFSFDSDELTAEILKVFRRP
jgi:hypothetical protein